MAEGLVVEAGTTGKVQEAEIQFEGVALSQGCEQGVESRSVQVGVGAGVPKRCGLMDMAPKGFAVAIATVVFNGSCQRC